MRLVENNAMPIHDWTRVDAGIFHDFHLSWIDEIKRALNRGLLPSEYYALAEQITGRLGPDVLTLRKPAKLRPHREPTGGAVVLAAAPPLVRFRIKGQSEKYAAKARAVVIRHRSKHDVIAMVEIVSPGNKGSERDLKAFVQKAQDALAAGIHLLIVDLFPPSRRDPNGIHPIIWDRDEDSFQDDDEEVFKFSKKRPLTAVAYLAGMGSEAFIEPLCVGKPLVDMPLFLTPEQYVRVPLEATYERAWDAVPEFWRDVVAGRESK
jgi:Protein of unknown function (DUF4058)